MEVQPSVRRRNGGIRVVVADDSPEFLHSFQEFISTVDGVSVVAAGKNGTEAVSHTERLRPELVILDLEMPGMDGLQATMALREMFSELRVIIISAHDRPVWQQLSAAAGADAFVTKPDIARRLPALIEQFFTVDGAEIAET